MSVVALKNTLVSLCGGKDENKSLLPTTKQNNYGTTSTPMRNSTSTGSAQDNVSQQTSSYTTEETSNVNSDSDALPIIGSVDPRVMSDIIIGLSDGLTVPFALTAGLSGLGNTKMVITGGMAELVSGAISMGLGGFLAAKSESDYYYAQVGKEKTNFQQYPDLLAGEVEDILYNYNLSENTVKSFIDDLQGSPVDMIDFIIRFGKGLEEPPEGRQFSSAATIGMSYFFGGFIPLVPYFFTSTAYEGLYISVLVMFITLFVFGYLKSVISMGSDCPQSERMYSGVVMVLTGGVAAGAAWGLVRLIE